MLKIKFFKAISTSRKMQPININWIKILIKNNIINLKPMKN